MIKKFYEFYEFASEIENIISYEDVCKQFSRIKSVYECNYRVYRPLHYNLDTPIKDGYLVVIQGIKDSSENYPDGVHDEIRQTKNRLNLLYKLETEIGKNKPHSYLYVIVYMKR